jgi:hypothetical protein
MTTRFTIRVVLHDANWQDYVDLANDLAGKGITDVLIAEDGTHYKMPPAEYNYVGTETIDAVYNAAVLSAASTGRGHAVLVSAAVQRKWMGLETVRAWRTA